MSEKSGGSTGPAARRFSALRDRMRRDQYSVSPRGASPVPSGSVSPRGGARSPDTGPVLQSLRRTFAAGLGSEAGSAGMLSGSTGTRALSAGTGLNGVSAGIRERWLRDLPMPPGTGEQARQSAAAARGDGASPPMPPGSVEEGQEDSVSTRSREVPSGAPASSAADGADGVFRHPANRRSGRRGVPTETTASAGRSTLRIKALSGRAARESMFAQTEQAELAFGGRASEYVAVAVLLALALLCASVAYVGTVRGHLVSPVHAHYDEFYRRMHEKMSAPVEHTEL
ncbi:unnamed protein product [Pedinophyceae sp. YPF-701]|nr:unnamed protein product [Pedinophyceae sp. YPF-701]